MIRQMDRTEVTVSIKGLNFNTPDTVVIEYLNKHGKVVTDKVIFEVATEGPFKGLKNGNRKYKVDFSKGINLGTFHILDGAKIEARYPGQRRTCGRCHETSNDCPGGGIAKTCNENGGQKVKLPEFMVKHWKNIGFAPTEFTLDEDLDTENDAEIKDSSKFTPQKNELTDEETARFTGIILKNLPIALSDKDINEVFNEAGAPTTRDIQIIRPEGALKASAEINNLDSMECKKIIDYFQGKVIHGNKVFCKGSSDLHTPKKNEKEDAIKDPEFENNASNSIPSLHFNRIDH